VLGVDGDDAGYDVTTLMRWDLSQMPPDAVVTQASITVDVTSSTDGSYRLYAASRPWSENNATWNATGTGESWDGAGGTSNHEPEVLALFSGLDLGSRTVQLNADGLAALQAWIDGTNPNNGFVLYHPDTRDGLDFASSEAGNLENRPRLTVTYKTQEVSDSIPDRPYGFNTVMIAKDGIWISWSEPVGGEVIAGYRVWMDGVYMGTVRKPEFKVRNLEAGRSYQFTVVSVDIAGRRAPATYTQATLAENYQGKGRWWRGAQDPDPEPENQAPVISGSPATRVIAGDSYRFAPSASDPDNGPAALVYLIEGQPSWSDFNAATGVLSGIPGSGDLGVHTGIVISVYDGANAASLPAFDIEVRAAPSEPPVVDANAAGAVKFFVDAKSNFDAWTSSPSTADKQFMRENYYRMQTYSSYFDSRLEWYPNAWVYKDAYALKPGWSITSEKPDWVLKDASGNMLYIPYACDGTSCTQYAADVGNQAFRNWWLDSLGERDWRGVTSASGSTMLTSSGVSATGAATRSGLSTRARVSR
jgi:hypothetical protein